MADPNALYSYKGAEPTGLPHRIILSNGASRTDNTSFTEEELNDAGFSGPYERPEFDSETQRLVWDSETLSYSVEELPNQNTNEVTIEDLMSMVRHRRHMLLSSIDWMFLSDSPISAEEKEMWKEYRQALRDYPSAVSPTTIEELENLEWPEKPQ